jgi:hypothetical protein
MILKMSGPIRIENLRHHSTETVDRLRCLLVAGAQASPDSRRKGFYDLADGDRAFYIHVSPTGSVLLLAVWPRVVAPGAILHKVPRAEAAACCR